MKKSLPYFETQRSTFANVVLHGIGPSVWQDKERWYCKAKGVEDVLVPSNTTLDLDNLSMFAVFEPYTAMQLRKLTSGPNVDPAWNMKLVNKLIDQANEQILDFGIPYSEIYSPEKQVERIKMDSGFYAADSLSTIDTWSFYFWNDEGKTAGWNKRIILDANYTYGGVGGVGTYPTTRRQVGELKSSADTRDEFLYNPGKRKYADKINELIHFQFGDLSAVAPFHYHSVRSLGFLLYAVCHLQNRFRCKFMDSAFEQMMQYFRVKSLEDVERALKINLIDKGFVDESIQFIPQNERWQMPRDIAELALGDLEKLIGRNSSIYRSGNNYGEKDHEKTATEIMADVNSATALVGAAVEQAYRYQDFQYQEIARRFTIKNSKDADVRDFRLRCLKKGVPESMLNDPHCWDVTSERTVGAGNKTQAMAIASQLLQMRPMFDPEPQREILKISTLAFTDDPALTNRLVPENPNKVSDSKVNAQRGAASLLMGLHVDVQTGENHIEIVEAMLHEMTIYIQGLEASGGMATSKEIQGLQNMAQYIGQQIQIIAQDPQEKQRVKAYSDDLGKLMNMVKAYAQRLQQQMQKAQQNGNGGLDPKDASKIQATMLTAKAKAANTRESHAQRTAQRQTQFELKQQQDVQKHQQDLAFKSQEDALELRKQHNEHTLDMVHEVRKSRMKSLKE